MPRRQSFRFNCMKATLEKYECNYCTFETRFNVLLKHHIPSHASKIKIRRTLATYFCKKCNFETHSRFVLFKHVADFCKDSFECKRCPFTTHYEMGLRKHVQTSHTPLDEMIWYQCHQCTYKSKWKGSLALHIKTRHTRKGLKWLLCHLCPYETIWKLNMKRHLVSQHTAPNKIEWIKCSYCEYTSKRKDQLKCHMKRRHDVICSKALLERYYCKCEDCWYDVKLGRLLKIHNLKHDDLPQIESNETVQVPEIEAKIEEPEIKKFESKMSPLFISRYFPQNSLKKDVKEERSDNQSEEKTEVATKLKDLPFRCDECSYETEWKGSLKIHKLMKHKKAIVL